MPGFLLTKRPCKIGSSINTRTEKHGDEDVTAMDIPLAGMILNPAELETVLGLPGGALSLFLVRQIDGIAEPRFPMLAPLQLAEKFEQASIILEVGLNLEQIKLPGAKLAKVRLKPLTGGVTELALQVQCTPEMGPQISLLFAHLNHTAHVEITVGEVAPASSQVELGLDPQKAA